MFRPAGLLAAITLALVAWLAACTRHETPVQAGNRELILKFGNGAEPSSLDPLIADGYSDVRLIASLLEGITVLDERTSQAVPGAAESWETSPDGLTWTFHLRAGLKWSNGDALVADDFIQSWQRALSPDFASAYAYLLFPVKNAVAFNSRRIAEPAALGFAAPDPRTIVITLEHPAPYLPVLAASASWYPVNPRVLGRCGGLTNRVNSWTKPANFVGNGAFVLKEWIPNSRIVVAKNPFYWEAATVRLNGIAFYPIEAPDVEEREFRAGQLHLTNTIPLSKIPSYRRDQPDRIRNDAFMQVLFVRFNVTKPPFDNPKLRRALALAIDRDSICRNLLFGSHVPAHHFVPPGLAGFASRAQLPDDFAEARRLLAEAGYPGGQGLAPFEIQVRNDELQPRIVEAVQAMWQRELGVHATIALLEQKVALQNQRVLDYTVGVNGWVGDFADPITFLDLFVTNGGANWTGWGDPAYDRLIAAAAQTADAAKRNELFQQAENLLLDQTPIAPLIFGARSYLIDPAVQGLEPAPAGIYQFKKVSLTP